jgi:hypothetical protein
VVGAAVHRPRSGADPNCTKPLWYAANDEPLKAPFLSVTPIDPAPAIHKLNSVRGAVSASRHLSAAVESQTRGTFTCAYFLVSNGTNRDHFDVAAF